MSKADATLLAKEPTTKERILEAAEDLMLRKSFHSVGLNEILAAVKVPKGSFYHYFKSKEHFGVELLKYYVADASIYKRRALNSTELAEDPLERLITYFDLNIARLLESGCQYRCLVVKLASEVATFSTEMRAVLAEGVRQWSGYLEKLILEGQEKGAIRRDLEARAAALTIHDLWLGAHQRVHMECSVAPLRAASQAIRQYLTPP